MSQNIEKADLIVYHIDKSMPYKALGIVLFVNNHSDWQGGGYYNIFWNNSELSRTSSQLSYGYIEHLLKEGVVNIFSATNNK
jgi:hypothetical protein